MCAEKLGNDICVCDVAIVVPIYKKALDGCERASLAQVKKILGRYDIYFMLPEGMEPDYGGLEKGIKKEYFGAENFKSRGTYSGLLLSVDFYRRFSKYRYMLIYQLDAFVFSDRLLDFCNMGYDYIGGPWARYIGRPENVINGCVGNGGFSLRRINSCIEVCNDKESIISEAPEEWKAMKFMQFEDVFFTYCGLNPGIHFRVPSFKLALDFSVDDDVSHVFKRMPKWMPFGCHAWSTSNYFFWKPLIEKMGYQLPDGTDFTMRSTRQYVLGRYCIKRLLRNQNKKKCRMLLKRMNINVDDAVSVWGCGSNGRICLRLLEIAECNIRRVYDEGASKSCVLSYKICRPKKDLLKRDTAVIVSSTKYEDEIVGKLSVMSMKRGKDYITFRDIANVALDVTVKNIGKQAELSE